MVHKKFITVLLFFPFMVSFGQVHPKTKWWNEEPYRLIQTNLREIDAIDFDVDVYVNSIKDMGANTVLINVGGIVANYYTDLEYHYQNPNLKFDLIKEVIARLHEEGIRVMGRFDFSKINETLAVRKPDWLYKSVNGQEVNYNGQVHTCLNGGYQQEYLFKILDEALVKFPLDGVFFNMIGYQTRDYGNNYHGICQSDACRERFKKWSGGLNLPVKEDMEDPVFRKYSQFKGETSDELFFRVQDLIRSHGDHIAICTYTHAGTDLYRNEANSHSAFYNDFVPWEYQASHNVKAITGSWKGKLASNAAVHFFGYPARHSGDSRWLTQQRLFQNMMYGSGLDFYCIGRIDNLEDRAVLENVTEVFRFHKNHEEYFTNTYSGNKVLLLSDGQSSGEYRGIFEILAENHIQFDVMHHWCLGNPDMPRPPDSYEVIIMPDIRRLSEEQCILIDNFVRGGGNILCTGFPSLSDENGNPLNRIRLSSLGVSPELEKFQKEQGTYFRIFPKDKEILENPVLKDLDLIYAWEEGLHCKPEGEALGLLGYIPPAMIGPPEKCYYEEVTDLPGLIYNETGKGRSAFFTFRLGALYHHTRHYGHSALFISTLNKLLDFQREIKVNTGPLVEVSRQFSNEDDFEWIALLNHTGQLGNGFQEPVAVNDIQIEFSTDRTVKSIKSLVSDKSLKFSKNGEDWVQVTLPSLGGYDVILVEYLSDFEANLNR